MTIAVDLEVKKQTKQTKYNYHMDNFHQTRLSSKYGFCQMKDNQDGCQNGCQNGCCICDVLCHLIAFKFHVCITQINLLDKFKIWVLPNVSLDGHHNAHPLSLRTCSHNNNVQCADLPLFIVGHNVGPYVEV